MSHPVPLWSHFYRWEKQVSSRLNNGQRSQLQIFWQVRAGVQKEPEKLIQIHADYTLRHTGQSVYEWSSSQLVIAIQGLEYRCELLVHNYFHFSNPNTLGDCSIITCSWLIHLSNNVFLWFQWNFFVPRGENKPYLTTRLLHCEVRELLYHQHLAKYLVHVMYFRTIQWKYKKNISLCSSLVKKQTKPFSQMTC